MNYSIRIPERFDGQYKHETDKIRHETADINKIVFNERLDTANGTKTRDINPEDIERIKASGIELTEQPQFVNANGYCYFDVRIVKTQAMKYSLYRVDYETMTVKLLDEYIENKKPLKELTTNTSGKRNRLSDQQKYDNLIANGKSREEALDILRNQKIDSANKNYKNNPDGLATALERIDEQLNAIQ